jgi:hypothetical protein
LLAAASLSGCTLESFEVGACQLGDAVGFKIAPINGWLRDYHPRPVELYVRVADSRSYEEAVVWATGLTYDDFDKRKPRKIIAYGQQISGWEVQQPPKPLSEGVRYSLNISDGGHHGRVEFEAGKTLPAC